MSKQKQLSLFQYFPNPKCSNNGNAEPDEPTSAATSSVSEETQERDSTEQTVSEATTTTTEPTDIALTSSSPLVQPSNIKFPETVFQA